MTASIDPRALIGHVHLKVSDLGRSEDFYQRVLGFEMVARLGDTAAFLSAGGYHHHIGLNTWHSQGSRPASPSHPGLYHFAILYPDRRALARAVKRVLEEGWQIDGVADHGVSEAIYLQDPDGNGIELYRDRDPSEWVLEADGGPKMVTEPLDVRALLEEADGADPDDPTGLGAGAGVTYVPRAQPLPTASGS